MLNDVQQHSCWQQENKCAFLINKFHCHPPCSIFYSSLLLPQLFKEKHWGEAKANLILKKTECHTCTSKQVGDLQGGEFKHFSFNYI